MEELRFDGRVALVTGAGRGVGREYALLLARRGAHVVVNDIGAMPDGSGSSAEIAACVAAEITALGGSAVADAASVAERAGAESAVAHAIEAFGRLDILIHNAGFVDGSWQQLLDINMNAAFWLTEAAWPTMHGQGYGRVLLTTSSAGLFGTGNGPGYSPIESYGATKMGALGLGRCLAVRGRASGIQVNMISPNAFTRLVAALPDSPRMDWVRRHSKPALVAPGSVFLVHESCRANGQIFAVGAGRMARIFIGETIGYVNPELTLEDVAAHFAQVCDPDGYHEPRDMDEVTQMYMQTVGGNKAMTAQTITGDLTIGQEATRFLADPEYRRDPWDFYARARACAPVLRTEGGVWLVTSYQGAGEVLRNDAILSRREAGLKHVVLSDPEARKLFTSRMLYNDRPEHTRLRRLVSFAFTRGAVTRWQGRIRELAHQRLDEQLPNGRMDLVNDFAYPVVEQIITELLGIRHGDLPLIQSWSAAMTEPPPGGNLTQFRDLATKATHEVADYVRHRIAEHKSVRSDDLLTRMIEAEDAEDGRLAEHELIAMTFELIFAGHETTSNFVSNGLLCLLEHPDQLAELQADRGLLSGALDEMLRYESPAPFPLPRVAIEDVVVQGVTIPRGETVVVSLASANRDPGVFADPQRFDIRRKDNDFISFGFGAHYCLGHALARLESAEIFTAVLDRVPGLRLDDDAPWSDHQFFRSLSALPVTW